VTEMNGSIRSDIHQPIRDRWSPTVFADRPVEAEKIATLFEAARWAASSFNEQPWRFIVGVRGEDETFEDLVTCLAEGNALWARHAAFLVLTMAKTTYDLTGEVNRHAWHDVGLATGNLSIQAAAAGLAVHPMGGFSPERARELFVIPEEWEPVAMLAAGYEDEPENAPEGVTARLKSERSRHPLAELVFTGRWGESRPLT